MHPLVDRQLARSGLDPEAALEFRLMFSCAAALLKNSPAGPPGALDRLAALHGPDWGRFVNLLHENRLLIPALRALEGRGNAGGLPEAARGRGTESGMHLLKMTAELARLSRLFAHSGTRVMAFKGPALSVQLYGDPGMRYCSDLDLLVSRDDHERAESLLLKDGFVYQPGEGPGKAALDPGGTIHTHFVNPRNRAHVELHFHLCHDGEGPRFPFEDLWQQRAAVELHGTEVPTLPLPLHGVYLAIHGERHAWERLIRLFDIAALVGGPGPGGFESLIAVAERYGEKPRLLRSVLLAHLLFDVPVPAEALELLKDPREAKFVELALRMAVLPWEGTDHAWGRRYWLTKRIGWAACRGAPEKWRYLALHFRPQYAETVNLPLPEGLSFLRYLIRPLLVVRKKAGRILKTAR